MSFSAVSLDGRHLAFFVGCVATLSLSAQTLFFDDFSGPLDPAYAATLPNAGWVFWSANASYLGASGYSFQTKDGASVIRLQDLLNNAQRKGWSSASSYASIGPIRLEARFNTLIQSPSTGIDELLELWILDASNLNRYDRIALSAPSYGYARMLSAGSSVTGIGFFSGFTFANNTWYGW